MIKKPVKTGLDPILLFLVILLLAFGGSSCGNQSGEKGWSPGSGFLNKSTEDDSDNVIKQEVNALLI